MRNTADIFYPIRRLVSYLQETIASPWLSSNPRNLEIFESKRHRGQHSSKQVSADFLPFFLICAFLVVIICLVSKQPKDSDDEDDVQEEQETELMSSMPVINETVTESSAGSVCSTACIDSIDYAADICPECDDLSAGSRINQLIPSLNFSTRERNCCSLPAIPDSASTTSYGSALSVGDAPVQQVQKKRPRKAPQKRTKHAAAACLDREWFVRRTRSGQIYGTYAF